MVQFDGGAYAKLWQIHSFGPRYLKFKPSVSVMVIIQNLIDYIVVFTTIQLLLDFSVSIQLINRSELLARRLFVVESFFG